eukprot:TRINITY_DN2781_c2_g1_i2.p1 TRINITY_DN2781_c2_g1~~TRINITY_DN2781_c2_g1_i2.p1  ORF type:complete len:164 (+),score=19.33 TRINITY_DN2781_c2_g1_i2:73-564(+)
MIYLVACLLLLCTAGMAQGQQLGPGEMMIVKEEVPGQILLNLVCQPQAVYELKVSYPATEPATIDISITDASPIGRSLLNVEKEKFTCESGLYKAVISLKKEGYSPSMPLRTTTLTIRLEELLLGFIPGIDTPLLAIIIISIVVVSYYVLAPLAERILLRPIT